MKANCNKCYMLLGASEKSNIEITVATMKNSFYEETYWRYFEYCS